MGQTTNTLHGIINWSTSLTGFWNGHYTPFPSLSLLLFSLESKQATILQPNHSQIHTKLISEIYTLH